MSSAWFRSWQRPHEARACAAYQQDRLLKSEKCLSIFDGVHENQRAMRRLTAFIQIDVSDLCKIRWWGRQGPESSGVARVRNVNGLRLEDVFEVALGVGLFF